MTESNRHIQAVPEEPPRERWDDIAEGLRVLSKDYGTGTVVAVFSTGVQLWWDQALLGTTDTHLLTHDKSYVARLERL